MKLLTKVKNILKWKKSADNKPASKVVVGGGFKQFKLPSLRSRGGVLFIISFALVGAALLYLVFAGSVSPPDEQDLINRLNAYRNSRGVASLTTSSCLTNTAREWSQHMAAANDLHHSTDKKHPGDNGFDALVDKYCGLPAPGQGKWEVLAENVGVGGNSQELFAALQESTLHDKNMLDGRFNVGAVGAFRDDTGRLWITQHFARCVNCSAGWYSAPPPAPVSNSGPVPNGVTTAMKPDRTGHWVAEANGRVVKYNSAQHFGDMAGRALAQPIVSMASSASGNGYWLLAKDGGIFSFGDAAFFGSMGGQPLNAPIIAMAATPNGGGYWLVASDGGIFAFGNAQFKGSMGGQKLNKPIVTMASTPSGGGYWLVASDGGIFAFGDAQFFGSTGNIALNSPIIGMTSTTDAGGYWMIARDGGVFAFGNAKFYGSTGDKQLPLPVVGFIVNNDNAGYYVIKSDGTGFGFGSARSILGVTDEQNDYVSPPLPTFSTSMSFGSAQQMQQNPTNISASWNPAWPQRRNPTGVQMTWYTAWDGGPLPGYCAQIHESASPWEYTWMDNQLCSNMDLGMWYTSAWPAGQGLPGNCVRIEEPGEPAQYTWNDNVLCTDRVDIGMRWSYWGNLADANTTCVSMNESSDPYYWSDNYLCWNTYWPGSENEPGPAGCISMNEPADPDTWYDNVLCMSPDLGLTWNTAHPDPGNLPANCVRVYEPDDPHTWGDNVLCSSNPNVQLDWSWRGNILEDGDTGCVQIYDYADPNGWDNNYLCWNKYYAPTPAPVGPGCVLLNEPADPHTWNDNVLCASPDIGLSFTSAFPTNAVVPANCTRMEEPADPHTWNDNVLCSNTYVGLHWSYAGNLDDGDTNCAQVYESAEPVEEGWGDNFICWYDPPPGQPDLIVTDLTWTPASPQTGNQVTFTATVKNQGTATTPDGLGISFGIDGAVVGWNGSASWPLEPGATRTLSSIHGGPNGNGTWTATSGSHVAEANVDDANRIPNESNENNNRLAKTLSTGQPDLIVTNITWVPASPQTGNLVTFTATVKNQGTAPTPDGVIHGISFYADGALVGWNAGSAASLAPGATRTLTSSEAGPNGNGTWTATAGTHSIMAFIDDVNRIPNESNENNNQLTRSLSIAAPNTPPTAPTNLRATSVGSNAVALAWGASTDDKGVQSYKIYRSGTLIGTSTQLSYTDSAGLNPSTTYNYQVTAVDAEGIASTGSNIISVTTTAAADTTAPSTPTNFTATASSATKVDMSWSASTDNIGVTKYNVYRAIGTGTATLIAQPTGTTYSDTTATANTAYTYSVRAVDAAGNISAAASKTVTTPTAPDTTPPTTPANLAGSAVSATQVNLTWSASTDNGGSGLSGYEIWRNNTKIATTGLVTSYGDGTVNASTSYTYYVKARDGSGNVSAASNTVPVTTPAATTTGSGLVGTYFDNMDLTIQKVTRTDPTINFSWDSGSPDASIASDTFSTRWTGQVKASKTEVYTFYTYSDDGVRLWVNNQPIIDNWTDHAPTENSGTIALTSGQSYDIKLEFYENGGGATMQLSWSSPSTPKAIVPADQLAPTGGTTAPPDTIAPAAPTSLRATAIAYSKVDLAWTASTSSDTVKYQVLRNGVVIGTPAGTIFSDSSVTANTIYEYTVKAVDGANNVSTASNNVSVAVPASPDTTPPATPTGFTATAVAYNKIDLRWTGSTSSDVAKYYIYRGNTIIAQVQSPTVSFSDTTVLANTQYSYAIRAVDNAGNLSTSTNVITVTTPASPNTANDTTPPSAASGLVFNIVNSNQVNLKWAAATDNIGVVRYDIYRNNVKIGSSTTASYGDGTARSNNSYSYYVKAVDANNNVGPASNTVFIKATNKK